MNKLKTYLKKTLKVIAWVILSLVLIFILVAILIQVPAIQTRLVHYATSFVSNKTHTKVEVKHLSISFPKSIVLEGLFLEDQHKDTLVYAGKAKVDIALYDLLKSKIAINYFGLNDVNINLYNSSTDSLFNYNFLSTAFSDTTSQAIADTTASKWTYSLKEVSLKNIRIRYDDQFAGMDVNAQLKNIDLQMDELDMKNSLYRIDQLLVEDSRAKVLMTVSSAHPPANESQSVLPKIEANNIQISNTSVRYTDLVSKQSVIAAINHFELKDGSIDLQKEKADINHLALTGSTIQYYTVATATTPDSAVAGTVDQTNNSWQVSLKNLKLKDDSVIYQSGNAPEIKNAFNASHLAYTHLNLDANDLFYSSDTTKVSVKEFSAVDQNNFAIKSFAADFRMDAHSVGVKNLKASASNSSIEGDLNLHYSSLAALTDSMTFSNLDLNLKNLQVNTSDILYFKPDLIKQPFFKNGSNTVIASGTVNGPMNHLTGKNLAIRAGKQTVLTTNFDIKGMPDYQTAIYDFPNLKVLSGKTDLLMMAGPYIPSSVQVPEQISLNVAFKGKMKAFESTVNMGSSFGSAHLTASLDQKENFTSQVSMDRLDLGSLMKDTALYGPVSLTAQAQGHGLNMDSIRANIKADVTELTLKKYTYHYLTMDGAVSGRQFEGKINLNDENAIVDFDGLVNLNPNQERYKFTFNVKGADLKRLHLIDKDLQLSFDATADLKGGTVNQMNGKAGMNNLIIVQEGKQYVLDSLLTATVNEPNKSEFTINSALVNIKYSGTLSPIALPGLLSQFVNNYFPVSDSVKEVKNNEPSNFKFEIQLHNHPILSKVLLPDLLEFEPGIIEGSFDSEKNDLRINANLKNMTYGTTNIKDLVINLNTDKKALNYKVSSNSISNSQVKLDNFLLEGKLADNQILASISSIEGRNNKLLIRSMITKENGNYKVAFDPKEFYVMDKRWDIADDNFIEFGKEGFRIHHLFMNQEGSQINIASVNDKFNDDLKLSIQNFKLDDISRIIEKDTALVKGNVDGNILLKRVNDSYGLVADATITDLFFTNIPIGNLTIKADNPTTERFNVNMNLSGPDNNMAVNGYFIPNAQANAINIKTDIQSLSLRTVQAFSMGQITEASGTLTGNFLLEGTSTAPNLTGELTFNNAMIKPSILNNRIELKHETIQLKQDGIYFNAFTMRDDMQHSAVIDGSVQMKQFSDFAFALQVNSKDFLLFNSTAKNNKEFFGRMVIDSKVDINGPMTLPVVNATVRLKKGSNFTFSVPEDELTTDKGEDVVEFTNDIKLNPILARGEEKEAKSSGISGFTLSSIIQIDKEATLRLLMDPTSADSLVVKGDADLSFTMDQSGKMSLTGTYNLNDGSYMVSFESVVKRKFDIAAGSTITWNGDPMDANISLNAIYTVRTSPDDLIANSSDTEQSGSKQQYPFMVYLKLKGEILHPEISFEIQLPPEDKGILGGMVNDKLNMLNQDESALNKQVFALLVLGRFVQENPFQSASQGGASALVRSTVSKFLSAQLNQMGSKLIPGMELNFDIQSYDDNQSKARTQVEIGVKQQLFNERLTVELGGTVGLEGESTKQNSTSDITSDVTVEYKLTKDGRFRMKGFRHNQYEAIEGQLIETGVGLVFVRDFNRWSKIFKSQNNKVDSSNNQMNNATSDRQ